MIDLLFLEKLPCCTIAEGVVASGRVTIYKADFLHLLVLTDTKKLKNEDKFPRGECSLAFLESPVARLSDFSFEPKFLF